MNILLLILFSTLLVISGVYLVKCLRKIAVIFKMSEFVAGFIIMAVATTIPELFVGISSALKKTTGIALGTVIGSNIANLTLISGIAIISVKGFKIQSEKTKNDSLMMVVFAALPIILTVIGQELSRKDAILLLIAFAAYSIHLLKQRKAFRKEFEEDLKKKEILYYSIIFVVSLATLFFSSERIVYNAIEIANFYNIAPIIIGLILVAIGTSLPELTFGLTSVLKGHTDIFLGDIIGAVIANSTLILGITALIEPITADYFLFLTSGIYMVIVTFIFATFVESGDRLYWKEGVSLIMLYVFFIIIEFYIKLLSNGVIGG